MQSSSPSPFFRWVPIAVTVTGCLWAVYYVLETRIAAVDDPETYLFINYLLWPLLMVGLAVVINAYRKSTALKGMESVGLTEPRRLLLIISVPVLGVAIVYAGFLIPSVLYVLLMSRFFGVKDLPLLLGLALGVIAIVWLGFSYLLAVPLQLWPSGLTGLLGLGA